MEYSIEAIILIVRSIIQRIVVQEIMEVQREAGNTKEKLSPPERFVRSIADVSMEYVKLHQHLAYCSSFSQQPET